MRGQVSDCICCTQGSFAACGRRVSFPAMGKKPKDRRGTAQDGHSVSIFALPIPSGLRPSPLDKGSRPPVHHYEGRILDGFCKTSGAQNLSGLQRFTPGHWALTVPELRLLRFRPRAWLGRANASGPFPAVGAAISRPKAFSPLGRRCRAHARRMRVGSYDAVRPWWEAQGPPLPILS